MPSATIVCEDSHTSAHCAVAAIAFGIGTSEVEMVMAAQCIIQPKPKKMHINVNGELSKNAGPKDVALYIIAQLIISDVLDSQTYQEKVVVESYIRTNAKEFRPSTTLFLRIDTEIIEAQAQGDGQFDTFVNALTKM